MKRATKVRIHPDDEQAAFLTAQFGAVRFVFNKALPLMRHQYQRHGVSLKPRRDIKPLLVVAKNSRRYHWLKEYDSQALQQGVINLDRALNNFFQHRAKFPRFKSKHGKQSRYHPNGKVFADAIPLPKMKPIKAVIHRKFIGTVSSLTITRTATGKYCAAILVDDGKKAVVKDPVITLVIGLDMGSSNFVITSNGDKIPNLRFLTRASDNIRCKQKALSCKQEGSANWSKARLQVVNCRADDQHKLSRLMIDDNQTIIMETLKSANRMKNPRLARAIGDASWHRFIQKLTYKAEENGKYVVKVNPWYASSKTCHYCGHKMVEMPLHQRGRVCPVCDTEHDRDINAANNIQHKGINDLNAAGLVVSAYGGLRKSTLSVVVVDEVGSIAL